MLVMHSISVVRRNRRLQTCGDFHHYYSLEEPKKASNPCEQGEALEGMAARIERLMGLTAKVSGPQNAGPLDRKVRPEGQKEAPGLGQGRSPPKSAGPRKRRSAARLIAGGACYTSARGQ